MDAMKWIAWIALAAGCQGGSKTATKGSEPAAKGSVSSGSATGSDSVIIQLPKAAVTPEYTQDITNLCDVVHLSGADQLPPADRTPTIAMWLGPHIKTDAGHEFLVAIQPLAGDAKVAALEHEARRVGLAGCALAAEWAPK
jgi:hypothetical protein